MIDDANPCVKCDVAFPDCSSVCLKYAEYKCGKCIYSTQDGECEGQCLKEVKHGRTSQEEEND